MTITLTIIIIAITVLISWQAFENENLMHKLIFHPPIIFSKKEYFRLLTCGFIHADYFHLGFNMISFYSFGQGLEKYILTDVCVLPVGGKLFFLLLYFGGVVVSILPSLIKHKHNDDYYSLGASGGVSSIIFATVLFYPQLELGFMFIPVPIPGYIFCFIYLAISYYFDKRGGGGNINHSAHFYGAVFGIVFTWVVVSIFGNLNIIENFKLQMSAGSGTLIPFQCK